MNKIQYGIWQEEDGGGYWLLFSSIEDAVSGEGDGSEVYKFEPRYIGTFKRSVVLEKLPKNKKIKEKK